MTGKHRHWHRAWALDAPGRTARHTCGLIVHYRPIQRLPDLMPAVAGLTWAVGQQWLVEPEPASLDAWLAAPDVAEANMAARLSRLMREAGDLLAYHHGL